MNIKLLQDALEPFETFIDQHIDSFVKTFCKITDVMDITKASFDGENLHVTYVSYEGQHFTDSFKLKEFQEWIDNVKN